MAEKSVGNTLAYSCDSIEGATSCLSKALMKKLFATEGCEVVSHGGGGDITVLRIQFDSEAYNTWKDFYLKGGVEPQQLDNSDPIYNMAPLIAGGGINPPAAIRHLIYEEVARVLVTYAPLRKAAFNGGAIPPIPAAIAGYPPLGVKFHHSTIAAYKVLERILSGIGLPRITAQHSGTNLVELNVLYSNCALSILLVKK